MSDFQHTSNHRAAKIHTCFTCGTRIETGDEYVNTKGVYDSNWFTMKNHTDCFEAAIDEYDDYEEWHQGVYDRDKKEWM